MKCTELKIKQMCNKPGINSGCVVGLNRLKEFVESPEKPFIRFSFCPICGRKIIDPADNPEPSLHSEHSSHPSSEPANP